MNALLAVGLILLVAILFGHLFRFLRLPEITGYIAAGILMGPSALGLITSDTVTTLHVMSEIALGIILFSIGTAFNFDHILAVGRKIAIISVTEAVLTGSLVLIASNMAGLDFRVCVFLAVISMSTAPAATMMVMREVKSFGPLTDTITGVVAVNKIVVLMAFSLATAYVGMQASSSTEAGALAIVYEAIYSFFWETFGSMAVGYLVGLLLSYWEPFMDEVGERQILVIGSILMIVGASQALHVSPLIAALAAGCTLTNLTNRVELLGEVIRGLDPPLYAIFFVLAGAATQLDVLQELGIAGFLFVLARLLGKVVGMAVGSRITDMPPAVVRYLGISMLALADLAIGLSYEVGRRYPDLDTSVSTIVLSAVAFYELAGPLATRFAIFKAGEANQEAGRAVVPKPA
ncbi:MAG: cation:proton antiporter [Bryobacterales bacterium]|nr:cation:proton antiporter [Bryobacterales bacterium]